MRIGIDNGVSGAVAGVNQLGQLVGWFPMPVAKHGKTNEINIPLLHARLQQLTGDKPHLCQYWVECPVGSKSAQAARSMAGSFHSIRGYLETKCYSWRRVTPATWQNELLGKGDTKPKALALAKELWPDEDFILPRCRVPHDGGIDAALIAKWSLNHDA